MDRVRVGVRARAGVRARIRIWQKGGSACCERVVRHAVRHILRRSYTYVWSYVFGEKAKESCLW